MARVGAVAVPDTSACIALDAIGLGDLLPDLFENTAITVQVLRELIAGRPVDDAHEIVTEANVQVLRAPPLRPPFPDRLSHADRSVISVALHTPTAVAIIDERLGRSVARDRKVPVMGTVAVIARAAEAGLIEGARQYFAALEFFGFRVPRRLLNAFLAELGEAEL